MSTARRATLLAYAQRKSAVIVEEMLACFYLIDAKALNESIQLAAGIPPARRGWSRCGRCGSRRRKPSGEVQGEITFFWHKRTGRWRSLRAKG
jgi:hypothetical protein